MSRAALIAQLQTQIDSIGANPHKKDARSKSKSGGQGLQDSFPVARESYPEQQGNEAAAFKKIVELLNASDKSELAIRERLRQKSFDEDAIDAAVEKALRLGFIDDMRYADVLIRSRLSQGKGSAGIARELESQGIDVSDIKGWPYSYDIDDDSEIDRALSCLDRKPPSSKNLRASAFRRLVQKGFSTSVASSAARMWTESQRN